MDLSEGSEHDYEMQFPHSCVIYLRQNTNTKDKACVRILYQDGTTHTYNIPIIKAQEYTKDEIFEKNLLALLPYYFMRYEKSLSVLCRDEDSSRILLEELLDIRTRLEQAVGEEKGLIYTELISHIRKIDNHLFRGHAETRERMEAITMGGQVYETLTDQLLAQGIEKGKLETLLSLVRDGLLSVEEAAKRSDMTVPEVQALLAN